MFVLYGIGTTLIGRAKRVDLVGDEAKTAEYEGYYPRSYQAVKWFVLLHIPVIPLGTYRVMKARKSHIITYYYRMQRISWDLRQVFTHYAITGACLLSLYVLLSR
jgi:hypothetical protein